MGIGRALAAGAAALCLPGAAWAAGGAHVIDDAEVETPGHCHLDLWATRLSGDAGLLVAAPACTPARLPMLEIGVGIAHSYPRRIRETDFGPSLKWELRSPSHGLGIAVSATASYSSRTSRVETAAIIVPLTLDVTKWLRVNANAGYAWTRTGRLNSRFVGGQAVAQLTPRLSVMGEVFDREPGGRLGVQSGLRWSPRDWIDIDILGAHRVDGSTPDAFTIGVTFTL